MRIREIRPDEAPIVTDLYLEACRLLAELDPDAGIPDWGAINRWITRTTETDQAVCLIKEVEGTIVGYLLASVERHPACRESSGRWRSSTLGPGRTPTG